MLLIICWFIILLPFLSDLQQFKEIRMGTVFWPTLYVGLLPFIASDKPPKNCELIVPFCHGRAKEESYTRQ